MGANVAGLQVDALAALQGKTVRAIMKRGDEATEQLLDLAAGARKEWDLQSWLALTRELDNCPETLEFWLMLNT